jgi:hypothetical protein
MSLKLNNESKIFEKKIIKMNKASSSYSYYAQSTQIITTLRATLKIVKSLVRIEN